MLTLPRSLSLCIVAVAASLLTSCSEEWPAQPEELSTSTGTSDIDITTTASDTEAAEIVDVKYKRRYEWYPAYANLVLRSCYIVEREITYSNGEVKTETLHTMSYPTDIIGTPSDPFGRGGNYNLELESGGYLSYKSGYDLYYDSYNSIHKIKIGVPDLEKITGYRIIEDDYYDPNGPEYYSEYQQEWGYDKFGVGSHQESWYVRWCLYNRVVRVFYDDEYGSMDDFGIAYLVLNPGYNDRFLYLKDGGEIDGGTIISFEDWRPKFEFNVTMEHTRIAEGPAIAVKHECRFHYLGQDFYCAAIAYFYENGSDDKQNTTD